MRKEIEVKAKASDLDAVRKKLESLGSVFSKPEEQRDIIFVGADYGKFDEFQPKKNLLRIRESGGKIFFTLKQPQTNEGDALEREVEISDANEMAEALELMGYEEAVRVSKKRRTAKYKDYEVCLDEVEGLGSFIELEKITGGEDAEKVQTEMFEFLKTLGAKESDRITHGYDTMVYMKNKRN